MQFKFPILLLAGALGTAATVVLLTPDPTRDLLISSSALSAASPLSPAEPPVPPALATRPPDSARAIASAPSVEAPALFPAPSARPAAAPAEPISSPSHSPSPVAARQPAPSVSSAPANLPPPISPQAPFAEEAGGIVVPLGRSLPASLVDAGEGATPAQIQTLDRIADDFVREIAAEVEAETAAAASGQETNRPFSPRPSDWNPATRAANERYRQIFGVDQFNAWTTQAAKEALLEKQQAQRR